ncbi:MAG: hypothetical protein E7670_00910 [Ruminococcaceae bacterium]|nr:hypothetical protein [Oscillospiraceae bacterium]
MRKNTILRIALIGLMAAMLECGKLVLAVLPNIEVVTLLCALFGYVFGGAGVVATIVFIAIEPLIYGFGTWMISYCLYWPLVTIIFMLLGRAKVRNRVILTVIAVILTVWFGVLSSLVDTGLFSGYLDNFFSRFSIIYLRGISFYVTQILCNAVLFPLLFRTLSELLIKLKKRMI